MSRRVSVGQSTGQRRISILDVRICLPQQLLGADVYGARCATPGSGCRRFGSPARGPSLQQTAVDEFRMADDAGTNPGVYCLGVAKF